MENENMTLYFVIPSYNLPKEPKKLSVPWILNMNSNGTPLRIDYIRGVTNHREGISKSS